jgi:CheY-like chemotaxis protein
MKKNSINSLRTLLISGFTPQQLVNFVLRKDESFIEQDLLLISDEELLKIALSIDEKIQADKRLKKSTSIKKMESIILIDDNEIDNFIHQKNLELYGASNVVTFTDTKSALHYLSEATDTTIHIFLDIYFPISDGFEFIDMLDKLEIKGKSINIFILSSSVNETDIEAAKQKKCVAYIQKPLTVEKLVKHFDTKDRD